MKNVLVRDLDDAVVESFKAEAKRRGTSLQAVLKQTLNDNQPQAQSKHDILRELKALRAELGPAPKGWNSLEIIQEGRRELDEKMARIFKW
jgi:phage terminase small subunit